MTNIQMEIGRELDEFAAVLWLIGMHEDDIDICSATEKRIDIRNQRARQVGRAAAQRGRAGFQDVPARQRTLRLRLRGHLLLPSQV